eukprot:TRINITY_DN9833_c0_g1_i1.p1 TRINITY_DN9833_c0_g1~~TRINITY_DN9833_c0_g1_i1.p1  ORF type:complete len:530 (+),score=127.85 TRINITY_DN9833_c0_g1_i1:20-1609(+)
MAAKRCDDQSMVIAFLRQPESYRKYLQQQSVSVKVIETHSAYIFLINDSHAFKMERAVWYPFMDMAHVEQRKQAAENEFYRNCECSSEIYQRMVAVTQAEDGTLDIDGKGIPVEWLIQMNQFEQEALLSCYAERGELTADIIDELIDNIVSFHDQQPVLRDVGAAGVMQWIQEDNAHELQEFAKHGFVNSTLVAQLAEGQKQAVDNLAMLMAKREEEGWVRLCHGDLHLRNVVNINGHPRLFDCIGFNDKLAKTDVAYDLAFLLMDLLHRDKKALASRALNRYLQRTHSYECLRLMPMYVSFRATIRAKVACAEATSCRADDNKLKHLKQSCQDYIRLALACLEPSDKLRVLAVGGASGTGKSTLASSLVPLLGGVLGAVQIRADVIRKQQHDLAFDVKLPKEGYSAEATKRCYAELIAKAVEMYNMGFCAVVDATFSDSAQQLAIQQAMNKLGIPFQGVWLTAPKEVLLKRVAQRQQAQLKDASDMTAELLKTKEMPLCNDVEAGWKLVPAEHEPQDVLARTKACLDL